MIHQFLSPHTNKRVDEYGGSFEYLYHDLHARWLFPPYADRCRKSFRFLSASRRRTGWKVDGMWSNPCNSYASSSSSGSTWSTVHRADSFPESYLQGWDINFPLRADPARKPGFPDGFLPVGLIREPDVADLVVRSGMPTWFCWRGSCCAIRTGLSRQHGRWVRLRCIRCSMRGQRSENWRWRGIQLDSAVGFW